MLNVVMSFAARAPRDDGCRPLDRVPMVDDVDMEQRGAQCLVP
jgi:hypothetical protein